MDQDIHFQHETALAAGAETTTYWQIPYRCTMRNLRGIIQGANASAETVTVTYGTTVAAATAIGVLTFAIGSAGGVGTWVADTSTGDTVLAADGYLKFVVSTVGGDAAVINLDIELDPYAR